MANNGDHNGQREHWPNRARIWFSEQNSPENQIADKQQLDEPGDADGLIQSSVNRGGVPQLTTQLYFGQRGASNSVDQGREQPQALMQQQPEALMQQQPEALMQQQPDTSRGKKRKQQQSAPDSQSPEICQTIAEDKLTRKRQADKRYRDRIRLERQQTEADLEKLRTENRQFDDEYQKMKSNMEKFGAAYQKMKSDMEKFGAEYQKMKSYMEKFGAEYQKMKSDREKFGAENGQLTRECQGMRSYEVELEAENRYSSRKNNDTFRSFTQGSGPPQSSTSCFQDVGLTVQPSNINTFNDWSHNRDNGVGEYFTGEEIRIRSHEMLENEDRQPMPQPFSMGAHALINMPEDGFQNEDMQLNRSHEVLEDFDILFTLEPESMEGVASMNMPEDWRAFSPYISSPMSRSLEMFENEDMQHMLFGMGGHASMNMPEDGYAFPPYMPSPTPRFDVVRWLKIKAAMRWGIFIRKKAAERRAQIVELEEEEW